VAQPEIEGAGPGKLAMIFGSDGTDWIAALIDALGHLQVDVVASGLPSGGATEATLASALTALQSIQNLVGALHDVGLDELDVQVIASALPTDAATQTTLASALTALQSIQNLVGALHDVGLDELDVNVVTVPYPGLGDLADASRYGALTSSATFTEVLSTTGPGIIEWVDFATNYKAAEFSVVLDGEDLLLLERDGSTYARVSPEQLNEVGGESGMWAEDLYDATNDYYHLHLKRPMHYKATIVVRVRQQSGVDKNVGCLVGYRPLA